MALSGARRSATAAIASATLALLVLLLAAAPASAHQTRLFSGAFGTASSAPANPYPLSDPLSVAVDGSGGPSAHDIYVADDGNFRVEKFSPSGEFLLMFGKEVNKTKAEEAGSTEAQQNLCTAASGDVCQSGVAGATPGAFGGGFYVSVDSSTGPSSGDVYVGDSSDGKVTKFDESGHLVTSWANGGQLDGSTIASPPASIPGPFGQLIGIAVDPSGNLWVYAPSTNSGRVFEFGQDASFTTDWGTGEATSLGGFAVDSADNVYASAFERATLKFDSAGTEIGLVTQPPNSVGAIATNGLAVDPATDELYVDAEFLGSPNPRILRYDASCHPARFVACTPAESFGSSYLNTGFPRALAIDPSTTTLYVDDSQAGAVKVFSIETVPDVLTQKASGFTSTSATLNGTVNPSGEPLTECFFEWGESTELYEHQTPCEPGAAELGSATKPLAVHAKIAIQSGHTYHFRLLAANANDSNALVDEPSLGSDLSFGPPRIGSSFSTEVTTTSATLRAELDPQNVDTAYHFEYGTEAGVYGKATPVAELGPGEGDQGVSFHAQGLAPGTAYHYRVLATSVLGAVEGEDRIFTTQSPGAFSLPDDRAWELVSPPDKHGAQIEPIGTEGGPIQSAANGSAITYLANAPTEAQPAGNGGDTQVLSIRGIEGWRSRDLALPHRMPVGIIAGAGGEFRFFSEDLSRVAAQPFGAFEPSLSPEASEQTAFLRTDFPPGEVDDPCLASCYRPLVTAAPGQENVPPGTKFGEEGKCPPGVCGPVFVGATPDLSHIVLGSDVALTATPTPDGGLYEWVGAKPAAEQLQLLSLLPPNGKGEVLPAGGVVSFGLPTGGYPSQDARHAISDDGSRVFWHAEDHLYMRDIATQKTLQIDAPEPVCLQQGECGEGSPDPEFQLASRDGSQVLFTDTQKLTADAAASGGGRDLYRCQIHEDTCQLTDLAPSGSLLGSVSGAGEDASSVYFVADGVLENNGAPVPGAVHGTCPQVTVEVTASDRCNLYFSHDGQVSLVAVLSAADFPDWGRAIATQTTRVSPNGEWLAFMSQRSLTGYDNRDASSGEPDEEVYLYNARTERLLCASCDPTGARPQGVEYGTGTTNIPLAGGNGYSVWAATSWLAANVPAWTPYKESSSLYQSRYLSNSGRLFFNASDPLVPSDVNTVGDVYEYEPEGVGSCSGSTLSGSEVSQEDAGCLSLISSGSSGQESAFIDASGSGDDVFFLTTSRLTRRDGDHALDVYDARSGGGEAEPIEPVECEGDSCQLPATPPEHPTPGTSLLSGSGNVHEATRPRHGKHTGKHRHRHGHHKRAHRGRGGRR